MAPSNLDVLTKSHSIISAKKRAKREQIKEVVFDHAARREFLTGFHKRKLQKKEAAKEKAKEREKQERLETRREHRRLLAERAKKNAEETEKAYGGIAESGSDSERDGLGASTSDGARGKGQSNEDEYEDEEQLATVTVVEEFDPHTLLHGAQPPAHGSHALEGGMPVDDDVVRSESSRPKPKVKRTAAPATGVAARAAPVKYQTNAARKAERTKQRKRKVEKAERAGGKSSRRRKGPQGRR